MKRLRDVRALVDNEFELARFDPSTGLQAEELFRRLDEIQKTDTDIPRQTLMADAYASLLDNVRLEINENTPFSVKLDLGIDYKSFATRDVFDRAFFQRQKNKIVEEQNPEEYKHAMDGFMSLYSHVSTDFWHTVPDWGFLLDEGFVGLLEYARESKRRLLSCEHKESQIIFLDSVITCYEAIIRLLHRIYEYSLSFSVPDFSRAVKKLGEGAPETLYEAMLFSILYLYFEEIGCERGRTLGAIDRLYYRYYESDLMRGVSVDEIEELFGFFFIHFTATKRFAEQPFCIGGSDKDGNDLSNPLTSLILRVYDELNILDPKIHFRYHKNVNDEIFTKVISMIRGGNNSICILNDETVYRGYERLGIPREDSQDYVLLGCYEPVIPGKEEAEIGISWINMAECIEYALFGGRDLETDVLMGCETKEEIDSFDELLDIYLSQVDYAIDFAVDFAEKQGLYSTLVNPSPIYSSSFRDCLTRGMDVHEYPLKYNNMSFKIFGLATAVDSLMAIKKHVYDRGDITLLELRDALRCNWEGYEELRESILLDKEKYGNNLTEPDRITCAITNHVRDKHLGKPLIRGGKLRIGLDSIDFCITMGRHMSATPDGRRAGEPVSKNLCATSGMDRGGVTAYMNSVLKIDHPAFLNASILDFYLHPTAVEGEKGLRDFKSLLRIYFEAGGGAAQGNILSGKTLVEAQQEPEKYKNLQVRVCGWNEYFVRMTKSKQDMFIKQLEGK